ncbi:hypothetical protein BS47DRAFT_1402217 [Hydnum rufescens UP504]|uniref:Uncharacterized protein n=1 Tax=Hydnum rufescens UP504 TaxID=1448309 RepID=A0A9P6AEW7_9AGAM|nr:hypothetical protein BS47DRAFT_1402217 [Hydnum rufescens UP504]
MIHPTCLAPPPTRLAPPPHHLARLPRRLAFKSCYAIQKTLLEEKRKRPQPPSAAVRSDSSPNRPEVIEEVKTMRNGRDGCTQLIVRVTKFLESFVDGLKGSNILDNTTIVSSLFILRRNLMAICADAKRWSSLNLWRSYIQRDQIISAISRHEQNLTDCFHMFQIVTSITAPTLRTE